MRRLHRFFSEFSVKLCAFSVKLCVPLFIFEGDFMSASATPWMKISRLRRFTRFLSAFSAFSAVKLFSEETTPTVVDHHEWKSADCADLPNFSLRSPRSPRLNYFRRRLHVRKLNTMKKISRLRRLNRFKSAFICVNQRPIYEGAIIPKWAIC